MATTAERLKKPNNAGKHQLFDNPILERLSRTHILVPTTMFFVISGGLIYWGNVKEFVPAINLLILFTIGWLAFTLVEYLVHRYVFHMEPDTATKANIQYKFHGVHHDYPKDKERLAMPPLVSITISTALFFIFMYLMGNAVYGFLPGFLIGYSMYLFVHYAVHAYQPPKNFLKVLWVNHGIHHYKDHERAFGVSSPIWDYVFRTMPRKKG
ncbi:MAG: sterol desaturase family protein [Cyclobacteriaceae bacterium]